ncbi:MAG: DUF72 domain-containing protein [Bdellovibrionales bacterium]|nr:DUF72 domain-containing protein [Bdellovibrionales bacterium]
MMRIGTAGWSIPATSLKAFVPAGTHLEKYSQIFNAVEINSCFYKDHLARTYQKWASQTPSNFQFSLKLHQRFTHTKETFGAKELKEVLSQMQYLEEKWGVLLLQFPGSHLFDGKKMERLFHLIRKNYQGTLVIEPRHLTWTETKAVELMREFKVSKVFADPEKCPTKIKMDFGKIQYYRLHGQPVMYTSSYSQNFLEQLVSHSDYHQNVWCIFDNTKYGSAIENALLLKKLKGREK